MTASNDHQRTVKLEASLFVELTVAERQARAKECTKALTELDSFEIAYREHKKNQLRHIRNEKIKIHELSIAACTGKEPQKVDCTQVWDIQAKETWYVYKKKIYEKREMTDAELIANNDEPIFKDGEEDEVIDDEPEDEVMKPSTNVQIPF